MPTSYAVANLRNVTLNEDIVEYLERIQGTLDPFGGRFAVHVPNLEVKEGEWPGTLVIIRFPSIEDARGWYESPAYQEILHLRTNNSEGDTLLVEGVPDDYDVHHTAEGFRRSLSKA
jgi:uncharacterized protein (DUF1330 family)